MIGVIIAIFAFLPGSPWWLVGQGRMEKAAKTLRFCNGSMPGFDIDEQLVRSHVPPLVMSATITSERQAAEVNKELNQWAVFQGRNLLRFIIAGWPKIITDTATDRLGRRPLTVNPSFATVLLVLALGIVGCYDYTTKALSLLLVPRLVQHGGHDVQLLHVGDVSWYSQLGCQNGLTSLVSLSFCLSLLFRSHFAASFAGSGSVSHRDCLVYPVRRGRRDRERLADSGRILASFLTQEQIGRFWPE